MLFSRLRCSAAGCCLLIWGLGFAGPALADPQIDNLSLRGLQAGGLTTLVIEGADLAPDSKIMLNFPSARQTIKEGATDKRLEVEIALDAQTPSGIFLLRVASVHGISAAQAISVDPLAQLPFAGELSALNVALSGAVTGSNVLATSFVGKAGQQVLIEAESQRLGAKLDPVVHLYNARRVQLAWGRGMPALAGDARCQATLPADGRYTIEIHDALFRGQNPGFFRLKIGEFRYAGLVLPLAVQRGLNASFEFALTNLPADARAAGLWPWADGVPLQPAAAPWPAGIGLVSGSRPTVLLSEHAEILATSATDKPQDVPAAPVGINGRIAQPGGQDRFRLAVTAGQQLRFDVLARRAGSPLDGVLSIQNEQGAELAANDDRPGSSDPGLDFKVPDGIQTIVVGLRDLTGRGGADFVYRIAVTPLGRPDFSLALTEQQYEIPRDGAALVRVRAERAGYNGPIKLNFAALPSNVSVALDEIPEGATEALVTLSAPGLAPAQSLALVTGRGGEGSATIRRAALVPENTVNKHQPWLRGEVALAVARPAPLDLVWDPFSADVKLAVAAVLPVKLRVKRADGVAGAIRLSLLTSQPMPRKKVKVNNQDQMVDDVERALRFEAPLIVAADAGEIEGKIMVPVDLPKIAYDLAIQAELLAADGKSVSATVVMPARRMQAVTPISLELAGQGPIEAPAGAGPTGKLTGKVVRAVGFRYPVSVTLAGLPKGIPAPAIVVPADVSDFEMPISFPFGAAVGDWSGIRVVAISHTDLKNPGQVVRSDERALAVKVVPGEKPAVEKPLAVFEDQNEFVVSLDQGNGQASLHGDEKYSGVYSVKVTPDQRFSPALPELGLKIREKPGPGEFRFLRYAWKKQGGQSICLQLNHDGQWGPSGASPAKFRYHAGPGGECFGASVVIDANLPSAFTLVTRDLFADFGEFTLSGLSLTPVDGEYALFDHIYLGTTPEDFELVKP